MLNKSIEKVQYMNNQTLTAKLHEYKSLQRIKAETEQAMKAIQEEITAHLETVNQSEVSVDAYKVTYRPIASARLDTKALKAAYPAIYAAFTVNSTTRRFTVL